MLKLWQSLNPKISPLAALALHVAVRVELLGSSVRAEPALKYRVRRTHLERVSVIRQTLCGPLMYMSRKGTRESLCRLDVSFVWL